MRLKKSKIALLTASLRWAENYELKQKSHLDKTSKTDTVSSPTPHALIQGFCFPYCQLPVANCGKTENTKWKIPEINNA